MRSVYYRQGAAYAGLLLVLLGTLWAGFHATRSVSWGPQCYALNICDSLTFRVVAELLEAGSDPYDEVERRDHVSTTRLAGALAPFDLPFQYPPNALPLFGPRAWASPRTAHIVFAVVTTSLFLVLVLVLVRRDLEDPVAAGVLLGGVALSAIVAFNAQLGQTGALAGVLVVGAVLSWRLAPVAAGALLGILAFKPQYAVPLVAIALLRDNRRIVLGAAASFAALSIASGLAYGFSQWLGFVDALGLPNHTMGFMVNWMGLAWKVAPGSPLILASALPVFVLVMVVMCGALWSVRDQTTVEGQVSVALAVAVVVSPNTHPYDLLVLIPALVFVAARGGGSLVGPLFFALTLVLLPPPARWVLALVLIIFAALCSVLLRLESRRPRFQNGQGPHRSVGVA